MIEVTRLLNVVNIESKEDYPPREYEEVLRQAEHVLSVCTFQDPEVFLLFERR